MQATRRGYPTTRDDRLPKNMPSFTMPIKAGDQGNQAFRYDPPSKTLFTDLELERQGQAVQFIDNVTIRATTEVPELQKLWQLTHGHRLSMDAEYAESQGLPAPPDTPPAPSRNGNNGRDFPEQDDFAFEAEAEAEAEVFAEEAPGEQVFAPAPHQIIGDYVTVDLKNAEIQRESDRMVIMTFKQILDTALDPKEDKLIISMVDAMFNQNCASYDKYFGDKAEEDDDD